MIDKCYQPVYNVVMPGYNPIQHNCRPDRRCKEDTINGTGHKEISGLSAMSQYTGSLVPVINRDSTRH